MRILVFACVLALSCSSLGKELRPIENGVISCLKAEKVTLEKQVSIVQIAVDAVSALAVAIAGDPSAAIDQVIAKYSPVLGQAAEATVACTVAAIAGDGGGKTKGGANALAAKQVIAKHQWHFQ
jgi:TPP-dependent indolepyruvate ferredoxin oxidoreductase alpha subunit